MPPSIPPAPAPPALPRAPHLLTSVTLTGGYLRGAVFPFSPGLNCIIGGRGAGKTTAIESLRFALGARVPPTRADAQRSLVAGTLGAGSVVVRVLTQHGVSFTATRCVDEPPRITDAAGAPASVSLDSELFEIDLYSQNEIEQIALTPRAQLDLVDKFVAAEMRPLVERIAELTRRLATNAVDLDRLERDIVDDDERARQLPSVAAALEGIQAADDAEAKPALDARAQRARERDAVSHAEADLAAIRASLEASRADATRRLHRSAAALSPSAHAPPLAAISAAISLALSTLDASLGAAAHALDVATTTLSSQRPPLAALHAAAEAYSAVALARFEEDRARAAERARLEQRHAELSRAALRLAEQRNERALLDTARTAMLRDLLLARQARFALRARVAESITGELDGEIRVTLTEAADFAAYEALLSELLRGANIRPASLVGEIARSIRPEDLVAMVRTNDPKPITHLDDSKTGRVERAQRVLDALAATRRLFEIETVPLEDVPLIELRSGSGYKPSAHVSAGQRCACILPILLLRAETPLVIDQPEDNLDNAFVSDALVPTLARAKASRQIILVTHNPNIPVLAEAERVFALSSDGDRGVVAAFGTVDELRTPIETILEGGREAFLKRSRRYGHPS